MTTSLGLRSSNYLQSTFDQAGLVASDQPDIQLTTNNPDLIVQAFDDAVAALQVRNTSNTTVFSATTGTGVFLAPIVKTDTIIEKTLNNGVTIDSVLLKDNTVTAANVTASTSIITNTIGERTANAGVTIDGVLIKDYYIDDAYIATAGNSSLETVTQVLPTGPVSGFTLTSNGDGAIKVGAGVVYRKISDTADSPVLRVDVLELASLALTDNAVNYIVNVSGFPGIEATTTEPTAYNIIPVGRVYRSGTTLYQIDHQNYFASALGQKLHNRYTAVKSHERVSGFQISSVDRTLSLTSGVYYHATKREAVTVSGNDITYWNYNGTSWVAASPVSVINNTNYDDGTATLATLTTGRYGVSWIYFYHNDMTQPINSHTLGAVYGIGDYTLTQAENATPPSNLPPAIAYGGFLLGKVIIQKNAAATTLVQSAFVQSFALTGATDHGELTGLTTSDDHTQYATIAGRSTAQTIAGGTASSAVLTLKGTSNAANNGYVTISDTKASTTKTDGALVVVGGVGVAGAINSTSITTTGAVTGNSVVTSAGANLDTVKGLLDTTVTDVNGFPDALKNLTQNEIQQVGNIDATTIGTTAWTHVGTMDQAVATTSNVVHAKTSITDTTAATANDLASGCAQYAGGVRVAGQSYFGGSGLSSQAL